MGLTKLNAINSLVSWFALTLYFPLTSILVIKKVGVIPNDEYTRRLFYTEFGALVCFVEASFLASRASGSWVAR